MSTGAPVEELARIADPSVSPDPVSVVIFNDRPVFRSSLPWKMDADSNLQVIADVPSRYETVKIVEELSPSVIVADLRIGDGNSEGIESITELASSANALPIVVTSEFCSRSYVTRLMAAGATTVVQKSAGTQALVTAIHRAFAESASGRRTQDPAA